MRPSRLGAALVAALSTARLIESALCATPSTERAVSSTDVATCSARPAMLSALAATCSVAVAIEPIERDGRFAPRASVVPGGAS